MKRCRSRLRLQVTTDSKMQYERIKTAGDLAWLQALEGNTDRLTLSFIKNQGKSMYQVKKNKHKPAKECLEGP